MIKFLTFLISVLSFSVFQTTGAKSQNLGPSHFLPPVGAKVEPSGDFTVKNLQSIYILYTSGADSNERAPYCASGIIPPIFTNLAGTKIAGRTVVIHAYCSQATGDLSLGQSMAEARVPDLENVIDIYLRQGVSPDQIFVAGHSMGGWAAVLVGARKKAQIGGVIAFAPANGIWEKRLRGPNHWAAYDRQKAALWNVDDLTALVYTFKGDPYNSPEDLEFMKRISRVQYIPLDVNEMGCPFQDPHRTSNSGCFMKAETERILAFIEGRFPLQEEINMGLKP